MTARTAILLLVLGSTASADELAPPDPAAPGFVMLDRQSAASNVGGELSYLFLKNNGTTTATAMRFDLHGQYADPRGFGAYAQLPMSYVSGGGSSLRAVRGRERLALRRARAAARR